MRVPELDYPRADGAEMPDSAQRTINENDEQIIYKHTAYNLAVRFVIFDWDLVTCEAALAIPRMPKDSDYEFLQTKLLSDAERLLEITN